MNYAELFRATEERYGLPRGYLGRTAQIESGMRADARNPNSSAGGLFQFIDSTAKAYGLKNRFDPYEATDAAGRLARDNMASLSQALGRSPSGAELYLAHQQGAAGAKGLLKDPSRVLSGDEITLNGGRNGMTAGEFASKWLNKFDSRTGNYDREIGQDGAVPIDPGAYVDVSAPSAPNLWEAYEDSKKRPQEYDNWFQEVGAQWNTTITQQAINRMTEGAIDLEFSIGEDRAVELLKAIPDKYHDYVLGSGSELNLQGRLKWVEEDLERAKKLDAGGWSAIGAGVVVGIADPIPLAAGLLTGGWGMGVRGGMAVRAAAGAAAGAATNAAIDVASSAILQDPYADPVMAGIVGAGFGAVGGILARNRAAQDVADEAFKAGARVSAAKAAQARAPAAPSGDVIDMRAGSMGAAKNSDFMDNLIPDERAYLGEVQDTSVPRAYGGITRIDTAGQMTTSSDPLARLFGFHLFDDVAGTTDHAVTPFSVNTRQTSTHREQLGNFNQGFLTARNNWLRENKVGRLNLLERARKIEEFNVEAFNYHAARIKPEGVSPHVRAAADAWGKMADNYRLRLNEAGMSDLKPDPFYVPLISDVNKVARYDREFHHEAMENFLLAAIRKHSPTISDEVGKRMAKGYWANIRKSAYGLEDKTAAAMNRGDRDGFVQALNSNLSDVDQIKDVEVEALWRALGGGAEDTGEAMGSRHLKRRTLLDYNEPFQVRDRRGNVHTLRVMDFFNQDLEVAARRYSRTMSGRVAFAETVIRNPDKGEVMIDGIRTEADIDRMGAMMMESYRKSGRPVADWKGEAENNLENLKFAWNRINGTPHWDTNTAAAQWARRIKTSQFIRLMSNMGLNQFQEGWKVMALTGFRASLSQLPAIRTMVNGIGDGRFNKDKLLRELTDMTGIGMDGMGSRVDFRLDDDRIGTSAGGRFTTAVDNILDAGSALTSQLSLMRNIQEFQQRWAMKAITQQMVHMARRTSTGEGAFDFHKLKPRDRQRLASMGIGPKEADTLFSNLLSHSSFKGDKITGINVDKWDPHATSLYRDFLGRYTDRLVQMNDHGALSKWMSRPVASLFVQFRSFVFGAYGKSTLWNMNHMDPKIMLLILGEIAMGTATYMVRQSGQAMTEEGRKKLWEEDMTGESLLQNGFARTATASVLPMFMDMALMANPGFEVGGYKVKPGPKFGNARSSGSPTDALFGTPVVDQITSGFKAAKGFAGAAINGDPVTRGDVQSAVRALPLPANWVPFVGALGALIKDLPKNRN